MSGTGVAGAIHVKARDLPDEEAPVPSERRRPGRRRSNHLGLEVFMVTRSSSGRKYGTGAARKVGKATSERKQGALRSASTGRKVQSRKPASAIGLSEARRAGKKAPAKKAGSSSSARKSSARRTSR
jgi:hypothetical protein